MTVEGQKRAVGEAAADLVEDGMTVGLGTGSTAAWFVRALSRRVREQGLTMQGVPTSEATATLATGLGVPLVALGDAGEIDLTVDGADEIGPDLALIKGAGGALLREKLVWESSRRCVVIADAAKRVERLGAFLLPVEVVAFGHPVTAGRIASAARSLGVEPQPVLRVRDGEAVRTDGGNVIYDLACGVIEEPAALGAALKAVTGVVEHGLFIGLATEALIGTDAGVERLR